MNLALDFSFRPGRAAVFAVWAGALAWLIRPLYPLRRRLKAFLRTNQPFKPNKRMKGAGRRMDIKIPGDGATIQDRRLHVSPSRAGKNSRPQVHFFSSCGEENQDQAGD